MEPLVSSDFIISDVFEFATTIRERTDVQFTRLVSVDVDSLFTNFPVLETIDIILNRLFPNKNSAVHGMDRSRFESLLKLAVTDSYFTFDEQLYRQIDGVAMGSPLEPIFANIFMNAHEGRWLNECPVKPLLYRRYVDDTLLIFRETDNLADFVSFLNALPPFHL